MFKYEILRPCFWFSQGEFIEVDKFQEYFTPKAVQDYIKYGYIKIVPCKQ